jgi:hypothetical protein
MPIGVQSEIAIATVAALGGVLVAWLATRGHDESRPGPAVRIYAALFRSTGVEKLRVAADTKTHPRREAFLAIWFLTFFAIFGFGVFIWPKVPP